MNSDGDVLGAPLERCQLTQALVPITRFSFELPTMEAIDIAIVVRVGDDIGIVASPSAMLRALLESLERDDIGWYGEERELYVAASLHHLAKEFTEAARKIEGFKPWINRDDNPVPATADPVGFDLPQGERE
jgi:hypothetical protein